MENVYKQLVSKTNEKIKEIRNKAQEQILNVQYAALSEIEHDFFLLGWNEYWTAEQFYANGQYDVLEQSVKDTELKLVNVSKSVKKGVVHDGTNSYEVSGTSCTCDDFVYNGLPCKHMFFLARSLVKTNNKKTAKKKS